MRVSSQLARDRSCRFHLNMWNIQVVAADRAVDSYDDNKCSKVFISVCIVVEINCSKHGIAIWDFYHT